MTGFHQAIFYLPKRDHREKRIEDRCPITFVMTGGGEAYYHGRVMKKDEHYSCK